MSQEMRRCSQAVSVLVVFQTWVCIYEYNEARPHPERELASSSVSPDGQLECFSVLCPDRLAPYTGGNILPEIPLFPPLPIH